MTSTMGNSTNQQAIVNGVGAAWDAWLSQHEVTVPNCIEYAVQNAFAEWLTEHTGALIEAIARQAAP